MLDEFIIKQCKDNNEIRLTKITNLEHAITQIERIISESKLDSQELNALRKKLSNSLQELDYLYLIDSKNEQGIS